MVDVDEQPGRYGYLSFNAPLSDARADTIAARLAASAPGTVLDLGCGWGELLLRVVGHCGASTRGTGVDTDAALLQRGRLAAGSRGLAGRVSFVESEAAGWSAPADVVISVGAAHAYGTTARALAALRDLVRPGGRLLYGDAFREAHVPYDSGLVWPDFADLSTLGGLVDTAVAAGFRPLRTEAAGTDELDAFESGYLADLEEWLVAHSGHPKAAAVRQRADEHRNRWLHGYRGAFGFAYLTLGVPA